MSTLTALQRFFLFRPVTSSGRLVASDVEPIGESYATKPAGLVNHLYLVKRVTTRSTGVIRYHAQQARRVNQGWELVGEPRVYVGRAKLPAYLGAYVDKHATKPCPVSAYTADLESAELCQLQAEYRRLDEVAEELAAELAALRMAVTAKAAELGRAEELALRVEARLRERGA